MILGAAAPGVIGELVIVPLRHDGIDLVHPLQIGVGAVAGVAQMVVTDGQQFACRVQHATRHDRLGVGVRALRVFVDVVADMHDDVEVAALTGVRVGIEPAKAEIRAGHEAEPESRSLAYGQGAGPTDLTRAAIWCDEAIEIPPPGGETRHDRACGEIAFRRGECLGSGYDSCEQGVGCDLDA